MTTTVYSGLWFDNQAKEASELYCSVLKNSKITAETPVVVSFELNGKKIMGINGGPMFQINPSISLYVTFDSAQETDRIWNALVEDGSAYMEIDTYPWSERYGWLKDKFGVSWQIIPKILPKLMADPEKAPRVFEAFKNMKKLEIDKLKID